MTYMTRLLGRASRLHENGGFVEPELTEDDLKLPETPPLNVLETYDASVATQITQLASREAYLRGEILRLTTELDEVIAVRSGFELARTRWRRSATDRGDQSAEKNAETFNAARNPSVD